MNSYVTGETIYEQILSVDADNNPVSAATFNIDIFNNGAIDTGTTVSISLSDDVTAIFSSTWSASTIGNYQLYYKNNSTNVIFISDVITVVDNSIQNIYVGL